MNKTLFIFIFTMFTASFSFSQKLKVTVKNLEQKQGKLMVGLYNSADKFLERPAFRGKKIPTNNATQIVVVFDSIPAGVYGIAVFQDLDGDKELSTGMFGIPSERYGFSNDATGFMSAPDFEDCSFRVPATQQIIINLK